eukprot:CAMPEP_0184033630 /NCGR_PEP_ID=MMETSP0955-20130417/3914_1 /TAXON_ID=627963 /ORGANISM="Aplanochytrium sp, Strain PBS07" /LENGTH=413 /DNA_ID=CAMNT_0026320083 /DNA_START=350 /DNA_END=1591 /DNA_ORIENTATION=-
MPSGSPDTRTLAQSFKLYLQRVSAVLFWVIIFREFALFFTFQSGGQHEGTLLSFSLQDFTPSSPAWFDVELPYVFVQDESINETDTVSKITFPGRTSDVEYNTMDIPGNYLIYSPSGSYSKQRVQMEYAIFLGKVLNRTVYIPLIGKKTTFWSHYNAMKKAINFFPMDRILDFNRLREYGTRLVPLNIPVSEMIASFKEKYDETKIKRVIVKRRYEQRERELIKALKMSRKKLLHFEGDFNPNFYKVFSASETHAVRQFLRYSEIILSLGNSIAATLGSYNGLYLPFCSQHYHMKDPRVFSDIVGKEGFDNSLPIYVSADCDFDKNWLSPLGEKFTLISSDTIPKTLIDQWRLIFPSNQIRIDMMSIMDQVVLASANRFFTNEISYFSEWVNFMRDHKEDSGVLSSTMSIPIE